MVLERKKWNKLYRVLKYEGKTEFFCFAESESHSVLYNSSWPHGLYSPWNSPGQNTGVGSRSLLQGIFPAQALDPGLPHCRRILYQSTHQSSPKILEWVTYPFSRGSSRPRSLPWIAGGFFTSWATRWTWVNKSKEGEDLLQGRSLW